MRRRPAPAHALDPPAERVIQYSNTSAYCQRMHSSSNIDWHNAVERAPHTAHIPSSCREHVPTCGGVAVKYCISNIGRWRSHASLGGHPSPDSASTNQRSAQLTAAAAAAASRRVASALSFSYKREVVAVVPWCDGGDRVVASGDLQ